MTGKLLIAGVGNIFLGDDGFGVEVANRLAAADLPDWVQVVDYGIRGMHLAYDLAAYSAAILIDAAERGGAPGTLYVIEPEPGTAAARPGDGEPPGADPALASLLNAHGMPPDVVLSMLGMLDGSERQIVVVGCEPASVDYGIGLSEPVAAAVDAAVGVVLDLVAEAAASDDHRLATKEWAHVPRHPG